MIFATIRCHTCGLVVIISRRKVFLLSLSQLVTMMNRIAAMTRSNTKAYLNMLSTSSMMTEESAKAILSKLRWVHWILLGSFEWRFPVRVSAFLPTSIYTISRMPEADTVSPARRPHLILLTIIYLTNTSAASFPQFDKEER